MAYTKENRRPLLVIPREHGAWAMLLVPLATGSTVGLLAEGRGLPLVPLAIAAIAGFWLRTPVESYLGTAPLRAQSRDEQQLVLRAALALTGVSLAALVWLLRAGGHPSLLWIGGVAALALCAQTYLKRNRRPARLAAQLVGVVGLTAPAPAAYCVATNAWNTVAALLWITNWLFASNQIQFVQLRIHATRINTRRLKLVVGKGFLVGQLLLIGLLAVACGFRFANVRVAVAFVPSLLRGFFWFARQPRPLSIRTLGIGEVVHAAVFGMLLIWGFSDA